MKVIDLSQGGGHRRAGVREADAARLRSESGRLLQVLPRACSSDARRTKQLLLARHGELAVRRGHDRALQAAARAVGQGRHRDSGVSLPHREGHRGARAARLGDSPREGRVPRAGRPSRIRTRPTSTPTTSSSRRACCRTTTRGRARCCTSRRTTSRFRNGCSRSSPSARSPHEPLRIRDALRHPDRAPEAARPRRASARAASSATASTGSRGTCAGSPNGPRTSGSS